MRQRVQGVWCCGLVMMMGAALGCDVPEEEEAPHEVASLTQGVEEGMGALPAREWTWVPISGTRCANGSGTGIGVRLEPTSKKLLLYLEGGGSCSTGKSCWVTKSAVNVGGYGAEQFAEEEKLTTLGLLDTSAGTHNPFAQMNMVMVPYCTGDLHMGTATRTLRYNGQSWPTSFVGAINMERVLARIQQAFPQVEEIWLAGTSAGGAGAMYHYSGVASRFGVPTHLIVDSAIDLDGPDDGTQQQWGVVQVCAGCSDGAVLRRHDRAVAPTARQAFLSFHYDKAMASANGVTQPEFALGIDALVAEMGAEPESATFIVNNPIDYPQHVVTGKTMARPAMVDAALDFLDDMVNASSWPSRSYP